MSTAQRHIIHRQVIDLHLHSRSEAFRIQSQVSDLFQAAVVKQLADYFDQLGLGDAVLRIPKIEIDLGTIAPENLERDFVMQCAYAIKQEVERILRLVDFQPQRGNAPEQQRESLSTLLSASQNRLEALLHFLKTGLLPPLWQDKSWPELESLWLEMLQDEASPLIHAIRQGLHMHPQLLQRLLRQFSPEWIQALLQAVVSLDSNYHTPAEAPAPGSGLGAERQVREWWLLDSAFWRALPESLRRLFSDLTQSDTPLRRSQFSKSEQEKWTLQLLQNLIAYPAREWPSVLQKQLKMLQEGLMVEAPLGVEQAGSPLEIPDKISVKQAGLVILHPFLPALFNNLEYWDEKSWLDKSQQERAMHVLLYLAYGKEELSEQEFLMAKLLCAWPLNESVNRFIALSAQERQEADELLDAVLQHWSALKSTSPALLRDGFLQRSGLLTTREKGWLLQLEHKAQDLLLDKLPWGIGQIKLPWMEEPLVVEW